jgi:hypothetical protein
MLGRQGKREIVRASHGKPGLKETKNITTEASMSLKTKEGMFETKLKRTQNELLLSAEMRAFRTEFELSATSHALTKAANGKRDQGRNRPGGRIQRTARKRENRGNEAKEYLKTKDITFFNAANYARFVR